MFQKIRSECWGNSGERGAKEKPPYGGYLKTIYLDQIICISIFIATVCGIRVLVVSCLWIPVCPTSCPVVGSNGTSKCCSSKEGSI